eukprot:5370179-Prymnesium_polylepis.2
MCVKQKRLFATFAGPIGAAAQAAALHARPQRRKSAPRSRAGLHLQRVRSARSVSRLSIGSAQHPPRSKARTPEALHRKHGTACAHITKVKTSWSIPHRTCDVHSGCAYLPRSRTRTDPTHAPARSSSGHGPPVG